MILPRLLSYLLPWFQTPFHLPQERKHSTDEPASADGNHDLLHCHNVPQEVTDPPFVPCSYEEFERIVRHCSYSAVVFNHGIV